MTKSEYLTFLIRLQRRYDNHKLAFCSSKKIIQRQVLIVLILLVIMSVCLAVNDITSFWGSVFSNLIIFSSIFYMYKQTLKEISEKTSSYYSNYFFNKFNFIFRKEIKIMIFNPNFIGSIETFMFSKCNFKDLHIYLVNTEKEGLSNGAYTHIINNKNLWTNSDVQYFLKINDERLQSIAESLKIKVLTDNIQGL
jgi:hypothetical protein